MRAVGVAIDGSIVPLPGSVVRLERPTGERDLYRQLAMIARSDAGIARAASRWGPIARGSGFLGSVAPVLGALTAPIRDRLAENAERWAGPDDDDGGPDDALFEATAASMDSVLALVSDRLMTALGMTEDDLHAITSQVATPTSPAEIAPSMIDAFVHVRQTRYPSKGELPLWVQEFDALGDPAAVVDRLAGAMEAIGAASSPSELAAAMSRLQMLLAPLAELTSLMDDVSAADLLSPLVDLLEDTEVSEPSTIDPPAERASAAAKREIVPALLAYWQAGDTPGPRAPVGLPVPKLADPDTWRSVLILAGALSACDKTGELLVPHERARDWQDLSMECALWRDALDRLRVAEQPRPTTSEHTALTVALSDLARRVGPRLGLPATDLTTLDPRDTDTIRSRLVRWITARCAIGGVEPRPRSGLVGTEGRALWSIRDALSEATPPRRCEWPEGCDVLLPPRAYAHRRHCDLHRREASRRRMRRWRQATRV